MVPVNVGLAFGAKFAPESIKTSAVPPNVIPSNTCNPSLLVPERIAPGFALASTVPTVRASLFPLGEDIVAQ